MCCQWSIDGLFWQFSEILTQFVEHLHLCPVFKATIVEMQISEF